MEEQKNKCMCGCGNGMGCMCGSHGGGTRMLFRMLLAVIILILVFWFGVRLGELRESIRGFNGYNSGYYYPVRMMQGYGTTAPDMPVPQMTPATPSAGGGSGAATH